PYFGHVDDLVTLELHDIDVVGASTVSRRRNRATGSAMGAMEHAVDGNVVPRLIGGEGHYLVVSVGQYGHHTLHPFRVLRERFYPEQRLGLGAKGGGGRAIGAARLPSLARLAGGEEGFGDSCDRCHVDSPFETNPRPTRTDAIYPRRITAVRQERVQQKRR